MPYSVNDTVWIHLGERQLVPGQVVKIFDLNHLGGNRTSDELYVIEVQTGIDDVYEVRNFNQISPDATGPLNIFRKENCKTSNRLLRRYGISLPQGVLEFEFPEAKPSRTRKSNNKKRYSRKTQKTT